LLFAVNFLLQFVKPPYSSG